MPDTQPRRTLSQVEQSAYWEEGYLFPFDVLARQEADHYRAELEAMERDYKDRKTSGLPLPLVTYKRINAHIVMPFAAEIGLNERILDIVEGVLGPDIVLYSLEFLVKEAKTKHIVSMHQDLTYWGLGANDGVLTAWLALSDATQASGCMDFVRGSHKNPILPHEDTFSEDNLLSRGQEIQVDVAEEDKVRDVLMAGQMSLHHGLTIHGSGPNVSDDRRIGVAIRYMSPHIARDDGGKEFGIAARGDCDTGNIHLLQPPKGLFDADALATYDMVREDQAKVMMAGAKKNEGLYA